MAKGYPHAAKPGEKLGCDRVPFTVKSVPKANAGGVPTDA
jgi:hypothetical protein